LGGGGREIHGAGSIQKKKCIGGEGWRKTGGESGRCLEEKQEKDKGNTRALRFRGGGEDVKNRGRGKGGGYPIVGGWEKQACDSSDAKKAQKAGRKARR